MPSTVITKPDFNFAQKPIKNSSIVHESGLVTASATFLFSQQLNQIPAAVTTTGLRTRQSEWVRALPIRTPRPETNAFGFKINSAISQSYFSSLNGVTLQGLFIENIKTYKQNGLLYYEISAVGALSPPTIVVEKTTSPRSLSKSAQNENNETIAFSFDYMAEVITASTYHVQGADIPIPDENPVAVEIWNRAGSGIIRARSVVGEQAGADTGNRGIIVYPRVLKSMSTNLRNGIVQSIKTFQFVYE